MARDGPVRFRVIEAEDGMLLVNLVARRMPDWTKEQARELIRAGSVYMGHLRTRIPTLRVATGERITLYREGLEADELSDDALHFVHRAETFVVLDKPAGVAVAATKETARGTLAEALRRALEREGVVRPYVGLVHRLDRGASGLVLFTIRGIANRSIHRQFVERTIHRGYRLRVRGTADAQMECDAGIVERPGGGARIARAGDHRAKPAHTRFRRLAHKEDVEGSALLEAELTTGRMHQVRLHAAKLGLPLVGDRRYGDPDDPAGRLHLHAHRLSFDHPQTGARMDITSALPTWAEERGVGTASRAP